MTWKDDHDFHIRNGILMQKSRGRELIDEYIFTYKGKNLRIVEKFTYLGVLFHWIQDAAEAWADREGTAHKAFGALKGALFLAPHLPFDRLLVVVSAIVGGVYRYGAELWGLFIPLAGPSPGSRISRDVARWLTGFGHMKADRCRGWFKLRELDTEAQASALRVVHDACKRGGLLGRAVAQLHANWATAGRNAGTTWMGRLHKVARTAWPHFRVSRDPLAIEGTPALCNSLPIAKVFCDAVWVRAWEARQAVVLRSQPSDKQQDFILLAILRELNGHTSNTVCEPIFPVVPSVEADAFQALLRFLAGKGDFARMHSQKHRAEQRFCGDRIAIGSYPHRRHCLFCWNYRRYEHIDSEWHSFFCCPYTEKARQRFRLALQSSGHNVVLPSDWRLRWGGEERAPEARDLAVFVLKCRMHGNLVAELSRFVAELQHRRERLYRHCIARGCSSLPLPNQNV